MKLSALLIGASLGAFSAAAQAAPVGMIGHISGDVTTIQGKIKSPARLLGRLEPGTTVVTAPGASAIIVLFGDGSRYELGAGSRASVSADGVTGASKMAGLAGPSANAVKLLGNARVGAVMARPASSYQRLLPISPAYFLNPAPRFDWISAPSAVRYTFTLLDGSDNVVWSTSTDKTGVDFPTDVAPLAEKKPYLWKISAFGASGRAVESRFGFVTVLSTADAATLDNLVNDLTVQITNTDRLDEAAKAYEAAKADKKAKASEVAKAAMAYKAAKAAKADKTPLLLLEETYLSYGVLNSALETLDREDLKSEPGVAQAKNDLLDSLSPIARTLLGRTTVLPDAQTVAF